MGRQVLVSAAEFINAAVDALEGNNSHSWTNVLLASILALKNEIFRLRSQRGVLTVTMFE